MSPGGHEPEGFEDRLVYVRLLLNPRTRKGVDAWHVLRPSGIVWSLSPRPPRHASKRNGRESNSSTSPRSSSRGVRFPGISKPRRPYPSPSKSYQRGLITRVRCGGPDMREELLASKLVRCSCNVGLWLYDHPNRVPHFGTCPSSKTTFSSSSDPPSSSCCGLGLPSVVCSPLRRPDSGSGDNQELL